MYNVVECCLCTM